MVKKEPSIEICILAGGESSRMGENKARLPVGRRTMLALIREEAAKLGVKVRVIRRDLVERCGPLGGILTGLKTTRCDAVLFLACDMPLVSAEMLARVVSESTERTGALFTQSRGAGFPFLLRKEKLPVVEQQIAAGEFSINRLCKVLGAELLQLKPSETEQLFNVNTPEDVEKVKQMLRAKPAKP